MPDISMCQADECPSAKLCYRHEAKPSEPVQAYSQFYTGKASCDSYIHVGFDPNMFKKIESNHEIQRLQPGV